MTTKPSHEELERRVQALETKNTQLEKNLHEARSLSEEVMTYMSEGLVVTDTSASIMFINKSLSEMLGYLPEEIIGKDWLDLVPADQQSIAKEAEAKRSQGYTDRYEIVLHRKNGDKFPVLIGAGPRFDKQSGQYIGSLGVVTDITDRKQAEEALIESEALFRGMFKDHSAVMLLIDPENGQIIKANQAAAQYYGYPLEKMLQMKIQQLNVLSPAEITKKMGSAFTKQVNNFEFQHMLADGQVRDVEVHSAPITIQQQTLLFSIIRDITERKQAEATLRESEERIRTIGDNLQGAQLYQLRVAPDGGTKFTYVSSKVEELHECKPEDVLKDASLLFKRVHSADVDEWEKRTHKSLRELTTYDHTVRIVKKSGEIRWHRMISKPRKLDDGSVLFDGIESDVTERKRTEEALRESLTRYDELVANVPVGVYVFWIRATGHLEFEYVSDRWCEIHQVKREDVLSDATRVNNLVHPDERDDFLVRNQESFLKRIPFAWEGRFLIGGGKFRWLRIESTPIVFDNGDIRWLGVTWDITDRKQAEEELKASERRARLQRSVLADLALNHAFAKGEVSDVLRLITRNLTQTLAVSRASIWVLSEDNLKLSCLMLYESDKDVFSSGTELQASGMPRYFKAIMRENRIYAEDAQNDPRTNELTDAYLKPLGITSMLDGGIIIEGRVKGVVCTEHIGPVRKWFPDEEAFISTISALVAQLMTNTERKRAEEALRESEQRYRTILDEMSEGYHEVDLAGNFTFFNEAFLNLFGYSRDEMLGTNFSRYAAEESIVKKVYQTYNEIYQTGNPVRRTEWDIIRKGGQKRTLEYSAAVVRDSENAPKGFRGIVRDITERKQAEAEREKLHAQLNQAQKMESVGRLAGGVAHDFNNMLGVILGHTELALLRTDDKHKLCSDLNEIQNAAKRSADITKQLLAFARKQTISPRQLDLNNTVESMLNMLRRLIGEDIDLVWHPSPHLWPVKMDPSQIDQILANLCVNTRDAIDGVGKLTIETGRKTFDEDYCSEHQGFIPGDFVLLAVSDNGCGMDKDTLENIFEPFFTTKEEDKGTGLGLATIYGIVKQNNGFINVYSEPGQGSTFKVYLPRLVTDEDTDMTVPEKKAAAGGTETILLVEDEPMILDMTTTMLEMLGYTVLAAASPDEAIRLAKDHTGKVHLLMSDVVLPEMNGRDLAGKIVHLCPGIRLLFMSGYTANVIAHQGVLDDGVSFIQKPFSMADMTEKVREVLDMTSDKS